ncbi:MAG: hypothetical protein U1C96_10050 [Gallionella sp.]|nr:hypothetical protein [Gallionella sp.]
MKSLILIPLVVLLLWVVYIFLSNRRKPGSDTARNSSSDSGGTGSSDSCDTGSDGGGCGGGD